MRLLSITIALSSIHIICWPHCDYDSSTVLDIVGDSSTESLKCHTLQPVVPLRERGNYEAYHAWLDKQEEERRAPSDPPRLGLLREN